MSQPPTQLPAFGRSGARTRKTVRLSQESLVKTRVVAMAELYTDPEIAA